MSSQSSIPSLRHDFDGLRPCAELKAHPARPAEIPKLAALARARVPGVELTDAQLAAYCRLNPNTAFSFVRDGRLLGGIALLHLNEWGFDALLLDAIDLRHPAPRFLAHPDETPAAIYWWALAASGRGIKGLGAIAAAFATSRYRTVDFYTQPSSEDGRRIIIALGFEPTPSFQRDLWSYRRLANRTAAEPTEFRRAA